MCQHSNVQWGLLNLGLPSREERADGIYNFGFCRDCHAEVQQKFVPTPVTLRETT